MYCVCLFIECSSSDPMHDAVVLSSSQSLFSNASENGLCRSIYIYNIHLQYVHVEFGLCPPVHV